MLRTLFETLFFLRAYQSLYSKPQRNYKEFAKRRWQRQLLTYNTPNSKGYSQCFITYFVLRGKKQYTCVSKKSFFTPAFTELNLFNV